MFCRVARSSPVGYRQPGEIFNKLLSQGHSYSALRKMRTQLLNSELHLTDLQ